MSCCEHFVFQALWSHHACKVVVRSLRHLALSTRCRHQLLIHSSCVLFNFLTSCLMLVLQLTTSLSVGELIDRVLQAAVHGAARASWSASWSRLLTKALHVRSSSPPYLWFFHATHSGFLYHHRHHQFASRSVDIRTRRGWGSLFECWMPLLSSSELHRNGMSVHMRVPGTTEGKVWALPRAMRWCLRGLVLSSLLTVAAISRACGTWRPGWSWYHLFFHFCHVF